MTKCQAGDSLGEPAVAAATPGTGDALDITAVSEATGRGRPVVTGVRPSVDGGRYAAKASIGEPVVVTAAVFADGHDELGCLLFFRPEAESKWSSTPMRPLGNDVWTAEFSVDRLGPHRFLIRAALDAFATWCRDLRVRAEAGQALDVELQVGASMVAEAAGRATGPDAATLREHVGALEAAARDAQAGDPGRGLELAASPGLARAMERWPDLRTAVTSESYTVVVDPRQARFSAWYEMFPRSASPDPSRPGTLADVEARLPYVADLGFDTLYLPPIHPVGTTDRKGRDGSATCEPGDPGSPWAIGSAAGGHVAIHPELGSLDHFDRLVRRADELDIHVALDLAFHCSPTTPGSSSIPSGSCTSPTAPSATPRTRPRAMRTSTRSTFRPRPGATCGTTLRDVVHFWIGRGVRVFRVDNPHTKPIASGSGSSPRSRRCIPTSSSSPRPSPVRT